MKFKSYISLLNAQKDNILSFTIKIIKPCRTEDTTPILDSTRTSSNMVRGIETALMLDLNVLSKMHKVIIRDNSYEESGLVDFISLINNLTGIYLEPGFATYEVAPKMRRDLCTSFDKFLSLYAPKFIDAPNATYDFLNEENSMEENINFHNLSEGEKFICAIPYLSMLVIWFINAQYPNLKPKEKYCNYIEYIKTVVNTIGAVENEIAKFIFFDTNECSDINFKKTCKIIRENFNKKPQNKNFKQIVKDRLNIARDIAYYRLTALKSNQYLDGKLQDTWLVTGDDGIKELSDFVYFIPHIESDSKYIQYSRNQVQKESDYWIYCDTLSDAIGLIRRMENSMNADVSGMNIIFENISRLEKMISYYVEK